MAYRLSYWKGKPESSEEVQTPKRVKKVADIQSMLRPIGKEVTYVALERTDKQSPVFKIVWSRPGSGIELG